RPYQEQRPDGRALSSRLHRGDPPDQKRYRLRRADDPEMAARDRPARREKTMDVYAALFKATPNVPDKGIEAVLRELARRRPVPKEFQNLELYRDQAPLERVVRSGWIDQLYKSS